MEATILPNAEGTLFEVWADGEVQFTHADKVECAIWANDKGYTITN